MKTFTILHKICPFQIEAIPLPPKLVIIILRYENLIRY